MKTLRLTRGLVASVDDSDYEWLAVHKWFANPQGYALRSDYRGRPGRSANLFMHRVITGCPAGFFVDHIDGDRLNNSRANLRVVSRAENALNRKPRRRSARVHSHYKGLWWNARLRKWQVTIGRDGVARHLGLFDDEIVAAQAYDHAAVVLHGEFARLNFPSTTPTEDLKQWTPK